MAAESREHPAVHALQLLLADADAGADGPAWSSSSDDLNVNLIRFNGGRGVPGHVNAELDVLIVVLDGEGILTVDGVDSRASSGTICLVPKGSVRALRSAGGPFAYLTCHRRRQGLWPASVRRASGRVRRRR